MSQLPIYAPPCAGSPAPRGVGTALFWMRRYLPAELAGTFTMLEAGFAIASLAAPVFIIGIVGTQAEIWCDRRFSPLPCTSSPRWAGR